MHFPRPSVKFIMAQLLEAGYVLVPCNDQPFSKVSIAMIRNAKYHGHSITTKCVDMISNHKMSLWILITLEADGAIDETNSVQDDSDIKFDEDDDEL